MKTHQITGIGPKAADGSLALFTILPAPFVVSAEWLSVQSRVPQVGDNLVDDKGELTLATTDVEEAATETKLYADGTTATGPSPLPDQSPAEQDAASKNVLGSGASASGSELSQLEADIEKIPGDIAATFHERLDKVEAFMKELALDFGRIF